MLAGLGSIDPARPRSRQIYESLRVRIDSGELLPGAKLPTELQLMQHFAVSRTTVSRALRDLELQGLIRRRRGSGTYVRELAPATEHLDLAFFVPWVESGEGLALRRRPDSSTIGGLGVSPQFDVASQMPCR